MEKEERKRLKDERRKRWREEDKLYSSQFKAITKKIPLPKVQKEVTLLYRDQIENVYTLSDLAIKELTPKLKRQMRGYLKAHLGSRPDRVADQVIEEVAVSAKREIRKQKREMFPKDSGYQVNFKD